MNLVAACINSVAHGDYLEVRRAANIKAAPQGNAETLLRVEPNTNLILVTLDQTNGYYNVEVPGSSATGWGGAARHLR